MPWTRSIASRGRHPGSAKRFCTGGRCPGPVHGASVRPPGDPHGPTFAHLCNKIGKRLGYAPVTYPRLAPMPAEDCQYWPQVTHADRVYPRQFSEPPGRGFECPWRIERRRYRRSVPRAARIHLPLPPASADAHPAEPGMAPVRVRPRVLGDQAEAGADAATDAVSGTLHRTPDRP